jgi:hypothetical protein
MALTETDKIDIIVKNPHTGGFDLLVYDDGSITDEIRRYNLVVEKLQAYLTYVRSGQLLERYPDAKSLPVRCCVVCKRDPNEAMIRLEGVKDREDPEIRLPVVVVTEGEYLIKKSTSDKEKKSPWWKVW